ncbi:hypothetical protein JR338_05165 [Chloroflexota bacterium]|nr:hypothetical protein JR338_05165 [Chloroflexota bacterium]
MSDQQSPENMEIPKAKTNELISNFLKKFHISWTLEVILAVFASIVIAWLFAMFARGGPNSSDITLYMNVGLNNIRTTWILNRYFHVFLQKLFLEIAPHPLEGYHYFWGFLIGMNIFLIYISARKVLKNSSFINGFLAVGLFFAIPVVADFSGVIVVDITAMTMISAMIAVYIISVNKNHRSPWMIALFGLLLFLSFKTKETTLPSVVLLIGFGWTENEEFNLKFLLKNIIWVLTGVFAAVILFVILNGIVLNDPLFGLRPTDWRDFFGTYVAHAADSVWDAYNYDWYQGYWFEHTLIPFVLFIISGVMINRKSPITRKMVWSVPLAFIAFLILTINIHFGYAPRFGLPILPVLSVLGAQFINLRWSESGKNRKTILLYGSLGVAALVGVRFLLRFAAPILDWNLQSVVTLYYYPILLTLLFASLFLLPDKMTRNIINLVIVLSLLLTPIKTNLRSMFITRMNERKFSQAVSPLSEFEDEINFSSDMRLYAINSVFETGSIRIGKDINELIALFNVYFDASATWENFSFVYAPHDVSTDIIEEVYDYILITNAEWQVIENNPQLFEVVTSLYDAFYSTSNRLVLLKPQN